MRKWIVTILVLIILAIFGYNYIYQDHRNIGKEIAKFEVTADSIAFIFSTNQEEAVAKYLNQTIEVSGKINEYSNNSITLNDKVFCQFTTHIEKDLTINSTVKIKGRVIGYDDLLEQVKLDQSKIN